MNKKLHTIPQPTQDLQILSHLHHRMNFSSTEKAHYENLHKGYLGELKFYNFLSEQPADNRLEIFDLLLEASNTEFQIDSLIIQQNTTWNIEVKYFSGDFFIEEGKWYVVDSNREIRNPLLQLQRSDFLLKQLLQKLNVKMTVKSMLVFTNEAFTLYQTPLDLPLIFPTQIKSFIQKLNSNSGKLTVHHHNLAQKIKSLHINESRHSRLPKYEFAQLKKGIVCKSCSCFLSSHNHIQLKCEACGCNEDIESAVMRSVREFNLLFPNQKITTNVIYDWCLIVKSKRRIREILLKNMKLIPSGKLSHYIFTKQ